MELYGANVDGLNIVGATNTPVINQLTITRNARQGISVDGSSGTIQNVTISNCDISYHAKSGIGVHTTITGITFSSNTIHHNCQTDYSEEIDAGGIYLFGTGVTNAVAEHNTIYSNGVVDDTDESGYGIWYDTVGSGAIIRYNLIYTNTKAGIQLEKTTSGQVYYNVVYNNHTGQILVSRDIHNNAIYNNTCYGPAGDYGIYIRGDIDGGPPDADVTGNIIKNNILVGNSAQLRARYGGENDGTKGSGNVYLNNCLGAEASNFVEWGVGVYKSTYDAWETAYGGTTNSVESDPLFVNAAGSDFTLQSTSTAIDAGTDVSFTTDYTGTNSIYGTPDIGAYEYQPAYTIGTDNVPTTGSIRTYSDGKYRMATASSTSATASFLVKPYNPSITRGSFYTATTSQYMDVTLDSWLTTGTKNKEWTATSTSDSLATHATSTVYTIGDLLASTYYQFKVDGSASSTAVTGTTCNSNGSCQADANGSLTFTYSGGYSTHTFALTEDTTAPSSFTLSSPADNSSTYSKHPTLSWNASSDSESGLAKYQLYIDGSLDTDNISSSATSITPTNSLTIGSHTWYVKALDNNANSTDSDTRTIRILSGGGGASGSGGAGGFYAPVVPPQNQPLATAPVSSASSPIIISVSPIFTSSLWPEMVSIDVKRLQQVLNSDPDTKVSVSGAGSPGKETIYFGLLTRTALKKFQCKYNIVCSGTPTTTGYGNLGPKTRAKIQEVFRKK